jgi:hypothetical protein
MPESQSMRVQAFITAGMVEGRGGEDEQQLRFVATGRIDREGTNVQAPSAAKRT